MADYVPILGNNVKRFDDANPAPWNDFFKNAAEKFYVDADQVMPFDAAISTGDESNLDNLGMHTRGVLGATHPAGYNQREGQIAISNNALDEWNIGGNTAEHEYMHNIETHFGDYNKGVYGEGGPAYVYKMGLLGSVDPTAIDRYHDYAYLNGDDSDFDNRYRQTPLGRYLAAPDIYEDELATSLTGYGGQDGEYEYQMMKDSWEKRGPLNQYSKGKDGELVYDSSAQEAALAEAFINNPRNERLGMAKGLMAPMIGQALADSQYELGIINNFPEGVPAYATHRQGPLDIRRGEKPRQVLDEIGNPIRNNPSEYKNSVEERFARLGAQYMKQEVDYFGDTSNEFNHNLVNQSMFRMGMNDLLTRGPLRP